MFAGRGLSHRLDHNRWGRSHKDAGRGGARTLGGAATAEVGLSRGQLRKPSRFVAAVAVAAERPLSSGGRGCFAGRYR